MNEAETRAEFIDKQLEDAGWAKSEDVKVLREHNINAGKINADGTRDKKLIADYVLVYKNIKLAVVEAKSNEVNVSEGVAQAKEYAERLDLKTSFAANGKEIYQINHANGQEGRVDRFPAPQELWQTTFAKANEWLKRFNAVPFENLQGKKRPRYYQEVAVNRVLKAISEDEKRVLLTLATGTGKTFIAFQIAWKLFKSRWTQQKDQKRQPRILFLTDRNFLADQAFNDFEVFGDSARVRVDATSIAKRGEVPKNGSIFFTIFQTFMSGKDKQHNFGEYDKDFFDLVIIDECHRGGANDESTWRDILDYFSSAVHLGLTATPKRTDNVDTYDYFGEPVFIYSLKEGIKDGLLTPFRSKVISSTIDEYIYAPDDQVLEGEVEEGRVYEEKDFNKKIIIEERERKRVQDMLDSIQKHEKTIVFCAHQAHAAMVRDLINKEARSNDVNYCVRVTANDGKLGETYIKQFQDNEKNIPTILTTSKKLTTGLDALNIRNIVLMRKVENMIEFKQIIGRGTRLFEGKNYFTIIDFVKAYHMYQDPQWDGEPEEIVTDDGGGVRGDGSGDDGKQDGDDDDETINQRKPKIRIQLSDRKVREINSVYNSYFLIDGKMVGAQEFIEFLYDGIKLPKLLGSEAELRKIWGNPTTRKDLLMKLEGAGCSQGHLEKLQQLIEPQDSDLFDVLEFIAYDKPVVSRNDRVARARGGNIYSLLNKKQREFVDYVLRNYINDGVGELALDKLSRTLEAQYGSIHAAEKELGPTQDIRKAFIDFQQYLYKQAG